MHFVERTISLDTGKISVTDTLGSKMPVVLLHGTGFDRSVFCPQVDSYLTDRYRLILVDLPGHGKSDWLRPENYTIPSIANILKNVTTEMKLGHYALVGWGMGGNLAIELASISSRVSGLLLTGCLPVRPGLLQLLSALRLTPDLLFPRRKKLASWEFDHFVRNKVGSTKSSAVEGATGADRLVRPALIRSLIKGEGVNQREFIEGTDMPVCFVNGSGDRYVRPGYFEGLHVRRLYQDHAIRMPGCGHAPFTSQPTAFNDILDGFVRDAIIRRNS
jgi:pimeloyl-[acyl-carrier protein] methyl ester esterase